MTEKDNENDFKHYLSFAGAPFILIVAPVCGYFFGQFLDHYFETTFLRFFFLGLGIIAGLREFYYLIISIGKDD